MTLVRRAMILCAIGLLAASAAMAGVPSAATSTIPTAINLSGTTGGVADILTAKIITVKDASSNPVPGSVVILNVSTCTANDIRLGSTQPFAGMTVNCGAKTVTGVTNSTGQVTFELVGSANVTVGNGPGITTACGSLTADGVALGNVVIGAFDEDGVNGVNPSDTSFWLQDRNGAYRARSDFDGSGAINPADGSLILQVRNGGGSTTSSASACP